MDDKYPYIRPFANDAEIRAANVGPNFPFCYNPGDPRRESAISWYNRSIPLLEKMDEQARVVDISHLFEK